VRAPDKPPPEPPNNIQLEQALLGAIFINNDALKYLADLEPQHFFDPFHARLYEIARGLIRAGKKANPVTLKTYLQANTPAESRQVNKYLAFLAAEATTVINAEDYGRTIAELALRRRTIDLAADVVDAASDPTVAGVRIGELRKALDGLIAQSSGCGERLAFVLFDQIEDEPKHWLVATFLGIDEAGVFYGEPGSGKSVIAEDLGLHVAAGMPWHGRAVRQGAVLYVALERAQLVKRRARAFGIKHNVQGLPFAVVGGVINFRDPQTVSKIIDTVRAIEAATKQKLVLIIIDTVSRALNGGDENSSKDMGELVATLTGIQHSAKGAAILMLHHVPHEGVRMRGHGNLLAAVDMTAHVVKGVVSRTATVVKANDATEGEQVSFTLESVELPHGAQAPVIVPVAAGTGEPAGKSAGKKVNANQTRFLDILRIAILESPAVKSTTVVPSGSQAVTRDMLKRYCVARGWMEEAETGKARAKLSDMLNTLAGNHLIGLTKDYRWMT